MAASISGIGFFMPIFSFLLVFVVVYAMLFKTKALGDNKGMMIMISFVLASFFIMQVNLVEFVQFSSAWLTGGVVLLFFLMMIIAFLPGDSSKIFEGKDGKPSKWFGFIVLGGIMIFFIISAGYVFDSAVNWEFISELFNREWVGMILLLMISGVVAAIISREAK
jgi:hypothetical protein